MRLLNPRSSVLVRTPSWLGDFVACEPVLRALQERWRERGDAARLTFVGPASLLELLGESCADVLLLPVARGADPDVRAWRGHDVALLLDGSWRSAWAALRACIPERVGWASGGRAPLLTLAPRPALERGATPLGLGIHGSGARRLPRPFASACVELAGLAGLEVRERAPRLAVDARALERVHERLRVRGIDPTRPFVLVNAGARADSAKAAEPAVLARLARATELPIVLACGPGEEANARATWALIDAERNAVRRHVLLDDPPPDLRELTALLGTCAVCITADSGPRHIAQALSKRTIVLCGPTDPRHTAEHATDVTVLRSEVACGPCHREVCLNVGERERLCMRAIVG